MDKNTLLSTTTTALVRIVSICLLGLFAGGIYLGYYVFWGYDRQRGQLNADYMSSPLSVEVAVDLCNRGLVPVTVSNCTGDNIKIPRNQLCEILQHNLNPTTVFAEVDSMFGEYKWVCTDVEVEEYSCFYQFGDAPTVRVIFHATTHEVLEYGRSFCE